MLSMSRNTFMTVNFVLFLKDYSGNKGRTLFWASIQFFIFIFCHNMFKHEARRFIGTH